MTLLPPGRSSRAPAAAASFAVARVRARPSRGLVTALAISLALASTFVTVASPTIAGDATLRRNLEDVPAGDRSITVAISVNSLTPGQITAIDQKAHAGLRSPGLGPVRSEVQFRTLASPDGTDFRLAGLDNLAASVRLLDGRLPGSCTPIRCEVVIASPKAALDLPAALGVVIVGRVELLDGSLLAGSFHPEPNEVPIIGDGVAAVGAIKSLELIGRSIGWVSAINPATVHIADIGPLLAAGAATVNAFAQSGVSVSLPSSALHNAQVRSNAASNRVTLAAAQGVVLLVAFVLLAAAGTRRDHLAARRLLRQRGASRSVTNVFTVVEASWPAAVGLIIGVTAGAAVTVGLAHHWHLDATDIVRHVVRVGAWRLAIVTMALIAATAVVMATASTDSTDAGRPKRWWEPTAVDGLGAAALAAGALAVSRGSATPSTLVSAGDPLLATLPLFAALIVAWSAIRLVPPLVAVAAHLVRRRAPLAHTALAEVGRRPALPLATAGFLAAATTLGVFSLGYRTTLRAGAHDQAAYAVPLDVTLTEGPKLVRPAALTPAGGWQRLVPSARSTDVLRRGVGVRSTSLSNDTVTLIGLDPSALGSLRGWRSDFGPSRESLPSLIASHEPPAEFGTPIPTGATALDVTAGGDIATVATTAVIQRTDGVWHEAEAVLSTDSADHLLVKLGPTDAGGRLIGFRLGQPGAASDRIQHHVGEGFTGADNFTAAVTLTSVVATEPTRPSTALPIAWRQLQSDGAVIKQLAEGVDITLRLQGTSALVVPKATAEMQAIPAIVDPATAATARDGLITVDFATGARGVLRVVAVAQRFPGAPGRFAVVDRAIAQPALDLISVGLGTANETWISVDHADDVPLARALSTAPFTDLQAQRRSIIEARLKGDPLSLFALGLFGVASLIAGLLAAAALYLSTSSDAASQAPLHRALAADGVGKRSMSRMVFTSALAIAATAIALGLIGALVLLGLVTRIIAVTATATVAVPPLMASLPATGLIIALAIVTVPCTLSAVLASHSARRVVASDLLREFG